MNKYIFQPNTQLRVRAMPRIPTLVHQTDQRSLEFAFREENRCRKTKTKTGAMSKSTKGFRASRKTHRIQRDESKYSCTVIVHTSPVPRRSRSPDLPPPPPPPPPPP